MQSKLNKKIMENQEKQNIELPENAFRELKEGEEYVPIMKPDKTYREVTPWSVTWGLLMAVLFSAAAAYLGLKVGQVFEAAIPIAIIAIGLSQATKRKNALGENVIIQSIGACSGAVVAGGIFVMPAIYMLDLQADFFKIFIAAALGGVLGILFLSANTSSRTCTANILSQRQQPPHRCSFPVRKVALRLSHCLSQDS